MIVYNNFWNTLKEKGVSQYTLIKDYNISASLFTRMRANQGISTNSINTLCNILDCQVEDILTFLPDTEDSL